MNRCKPVDLSSSHRPIFLPGERLLASQGQVGLYDGKDKSSLHQEGVCYITSHRLIYVDAKIPRINSVQLDLDTIKSIDAYAGFLSRSPKITIFFNNAPTPVTSTPDTPISKPVATWLCPICSFQNTDDIEKCQLCGVLRPANIHINTPSSSESAPESSKNSCPVCTFINHPSMQRCEMCDTELKSASTTSSAATSLEPETPSPSSPSPTPEEVDDNSPFIKVAFRGSGYATCLSNLKNAIGNRAWEQVQKPGPEPDRQVMNPRGAGISAIQERIERTQLDAAETLTDAFKDLDGLMAKAAEMVRLAESITTKISKEPQGSSETDTITLNTYLMELGISNPVTKDSTGSGYHQELARELSDFLVPVLERQGGMKSLADVYCLFNRARGVALISPEDLYKASCQFSTLNMPIRLKRYESGLLVIQSLNLSDDRVAQRIFNHVKKYGPLTAIKISELENLALPVAVEQLNMTEAKGFLCRDASSAGITFYENRFLQSH
ncbi:Vacuolar protein-sorting-associated protein 36 [Umbelopsis sp. WA50703]